MVKVTSSLRDGIWDYKYQCVEYENEYEYENGI